MLRQQQTLIWIVEDRYNFFYHYVVIICALHYILKCSYFYRAIAKDYRNSLKGDLEILQVWIKIKRVHHQTSKKRWAHFYLTIINYYVAENLHVPNCFCGDCMTKPFIATYTIIKHIISSFIEFPHGNNTFHLNKAVSLVWGRYIIKGTDLNICAKINIYV